MDFQTAFVLLLHSLHLFTPHRQTLEVYQGILKPYLHDGYRFIAQRFAYPKGFTVLSGMIEDLHISVRKLSKKVLSHHPHRELTLNVFTAALCLVAQHYLNSDV